jgi:hypothetical protein
MSERLGSSAIDVECYAGYRGEESPRRVRVGDACVEVAAILDRWLGPDHRYFRIRGEDGSTYLVRHDLSEDRWELELYEEVLV